MKKFFRFFAMAIVAMAVVSCDKKGIEDIEIATLSPQEEIQVAIEEFRNYDVNTVTELLSNKTWKFSCEARYNDDWTEVISILKFGDPTEGGSLDKKYLFAENGEYKYFYKGEENSTGSWTFDAETREIELTGTANSSKTKIIALTDNLLIWEYHYKLATIPDDLESTTYVTFNKRQVFVVEE